MKFNWDFIYFIHLNSFLRVEDLTNSVPSNPDESKMHIFDIIGKFKSVCLEIAKEVIDDLLLPRYAQKYINYLVSQPETSLFDSNELLYEIKEKSLNLRVCSYKNNSDLKIKSLKHEFKTMKFLADHLISIQEKKPDFRYYVPLSSKITYKGYVALITSLPPLESPPKLSVIKIDKSQQSYEEEYSLKLGPTKEGHYILDKKIHNDLILLAKSLNLQPHHYKWSLKEEPLPIALSISTQIHLANKKSWMEFSAFNQVNDIEDLNCLVETLKTQKPEQFEIYYLKNVADVFPLEIGVDSNNPKDFKQQRFRPEFIIRYPTSLSSDIFLNPLSNPESEEQNMEGYHAAEKIKSKSLEIYLKDLLEFKIKDIPISSRNFKTTLHSYGINMRHLGELCKKCVGESLAFLKNMCEIEMISRVCKVIFQTKLVNFCENFAKNKFYFEENNKNTSIDNMMQTSIIINQSKQFLQNSFEDSANEENINSESNFNGSNSVLDIQTELIMELSEEIIDFFNLIFGKGKENELFWKEIVQKKIKEKFGFCFNLDGFENFQVFFKYIFKYLIFSKIENILFINHIKIKKNLG